MSKPEISTMLTLSAAHVRDSTLRLLEKEPVENNLCLAVYPKSEFGYIIYVPDESDLRGIGLRWPDEDGPGNTPPANWPDDLKDVLLYCRDMGCDILCLDSDGPVIPYLRSYEDSYE